MAMTMSDLEPQRGESLDYQRLEPKNAKEIDWEGIVQGFLWGIGFGLIVGILGGALGSIYFLAVFNAPICLAIAPFRWFNMITLWLSGGALYGVYGALLCSFPKGKKRWVVMVICVFHIISLLFMRLVL
jgi:hypothetical protein